MGTELSAILQDIQRVVDQIHKHCKKIPVAKKESSQLMDLCNDLIKRLSDRSLILQQSNYEGIKSDLALVEGKLGGWSKYNYPKSLMKRADIELGVTACVEQLISVAHWIGVVSQRFLRGRVQVKRPLALLRELVTMQKVRFNEPLPRPTAKHEAESQPAEANEVPPIKILDGEVERLGEIAFAAGTRCEVWVGQWGKKGTKKATGEEVGGEKADVEKLALKALKILVSERASKKLERELPRWAALRHQNVLPLYGIVTDIGTRLYMVSPWQENGNLLAYVKNNDPRPNKTHLLCGSAAGLDYLHSRGVVHGSVKCTNVLISHEGDPLVCDFAMAKVVEETTENTTPKTMTAADAVRYSAIELIQDNNVSPTTHSDTYSFAMLIVECITEEIPFSHLSHDAAVIHARVLKKQFPPRPGAQDPKDQNTVSDGLWDLMMRCWSIKPDARPTMKQVHHFLLDQA